MVFLIRKETQSTSEAERDINRLVDKFFERYLSRLRERELCYTVSLASGTVSNMEQYKLLSGKLQGIKEASHVFLELHKAMTGGEKVISESKS